MLLNNTIFFIREINFTKRSFSGVVGVVREAKNIIDQWVVCQSKGPVLKGR